MNDEYTLKEAFQKGFLYNGDLVDFLELYQLRLRKGMYIGDKFYYLSLSECFPDLPDQYERDKKNDHLGAIRFEKGKYIINFAWRVSGYDDSERRARIITDSLLTLNEYGIVARYLEHRGNLVDALQLELPEDIIVNFTDEAKPLLVRPKRTVYTKQQELPF